MRPADLNRWPESTRVRLDVREDIRAGREPFVRIMTVVDALPPDGVLVLRVPFEPVPLYRVLGRRGFAHKPSSERGRCESRGSAAIRASWRISMASSRSPGCGM